MEFYHQWLQLISYLSLSLNFIEFRMYRICSRLSNPAAQTMTQISPSNFELELEVEGLNRVIARLIFDVFRSSQAVSQPSQLAILVGSMNVLSCQDKGEDLFDIRCHYPF